MKYNGKKIICLVGESGCGKTTLEKELTKSGLFEKFITTTTRDPREGETPGKDFFYVKKEDFERKKENKELITETFFDNNYYGMELKELDKLKESHCIAVLDVAGCIKIAENIGREHVHFYYISTDKIKREEFLNIRFKDDKKRMLKRIANDKVHFEKVLELDKITEITNNYDDESLNKMIKKIITDL